MFGSLTKLGRLAAFAMAVRAIPMPLSPLTKRFDCSNPVQGLQPDDCQYMSDIGIADQGANPGSGDPTMWVGDDGPFTFTFTNHANVPVIVVLWGEPQPPPGQPGGQNQWLNVSPPKVSYSLTNQDDTVTVSLQDHISGGFSVLYDHKTTLSPNGQVFNTFGEFTTNGNDWSTINISREVNMGGNTLNAVTGGGCKSDMEMCSFHCTNGQNVCGEDYTYDLVNCDNANNPGAYKGYFNDQPNGGCKNWGTPGHVDIEIA